MRGCSPSGPGRRVVQTRRKRTDRPPPLRPQRDTNFATFIRQQKFSPSCNAAPLRRPSSLHQPLRRPGLPSPVAGEGPGVREKCRAPARGSKVSLPFHASGERAGGEVAARHPPGDAELVAAALAQVSEEIQQQRVHFVRALLLRPVRAVLDVLHANARDERRHGARHLRFQDGVLTGRHHHRFDV